MKERYFQRVTKQTPTRLWINNPTRQEADWAIAEGAVSCTLNPSYTQKMIDDPVEGAYALQLLDETILETASDVEAVASFQRKLARPVCERFLPIFEASGGRQGYVSIQGDPGREHDATVIIDEAIVNRQVAPNVCCKIPTTASGLKAMAALIPLDKAINATEIFAIRQGLDVGELYESLVQRGSSGPMLFYSHIAGIYDDYLRDYVAVTGVDISPDLLAQAGLAASRKLYRLVQERGYRMHFIGGGARGVHHFTELVGGEVNLTINWKGTADRLLAEDPSVVYRIFNPVPPHVIDELMAKLPDFQRGYLEDGLAVDEYEEFGPVVLFRSTFVKSWTRVLELAGRRRLALRTPAGPMAAA
jgi:transaldolase